VPGRYFLIIVDIMKQVAVCTATSRHDHIMICLAQLFRLSLKINYMQKNEPSKKNTTASKKHATGKDNSELRDFFVDEIKDIYWAEKHLVKTLPKMKKAAFTSHSPTCRKTGEGIQPSWRKSTGEEMRRNGRNY